jgi:curved DNA-binding protein CbpA
LYTNGDEYEGPLENGLPSGKGKLTYKNKNVFEGRFANGLPTTEGKLLYTNGDEYEGPIANGQPNGRGTLKFKADGDKKSLTGQFTHGLLTEGKLLYTNGDEYEGPIANGQPNGQGKLEYNNGKDNFEGGFQDGKSKLLEFFKLANKPGVTERELLSIPEGSDIKEAKKQYRKISLLYHPDKFTSENDKKHATKAFGIIGNAYEKLYPKKDSKNPKEEEDVPHAEPSTRGQSGKQEQSQKPESPPKQEPKPPRKPESPPKREPPKTEQTQQEPPKTEQTKQEQTKQEQTKQEPQNTAFYTKAALGLGAAGLLYYGYKKLKKSSKKTDSTESQSRQQRRKSKKRTKRKREYSSE